MLFKKIGQSAWVRAIALFAIVFLSIAPTVSHAISKWRGEVSIVQSICTTGSRTVTLAITTTKGKQLSRIFNISNDEQQPASVVQKLNHCPFCHLEVDSHALPMQAANSIGSYDLSCQQWTVFDYHEHLASTTTRHILTRAPPFNPKHLRF